MSNVTNLNRVQCKNFLRTTINKSGAADELTMLLVQLLESMDKQDRKR